MLCSCSPTRGKWRPQCKKWFCSFTLSNEMNFSDCTCGRDHTPDAMQRYHRAFLFTAAQLQEAHTCNRRKSGRKLRDSRNKYQHKKIKIMASSRRFDNFETYRFTFGVDFVFRHHNELGTSPIERQQSGLKIHGRKTF